MEYHDECLDTLCDYEPELEEEGTKVSVPTRKKRRGGVMSADTHLLEIDEDEDEDEENMTSNTIFYARRHRKRVKKRQQYSVRRPYLTLLGQLKWN